MTHKQVLSHHHKRPPNLLRIGIQQKQEIAPSTTTQVDRPNTIAASSHPSEATADNLPNTNTADNALYIGRQPPPLEGKGSFLMAHQRATLVFMRTPPPSAPKTQHGPPTASTNDQDTSAFILSSHNSTSKVTTLTR
ncbi:hypothetical protein CEP52_004232 [Fusarium oligoseptatum]|uniref:Uncharacterized protein n=1 Tax=Fusarium oligoseptatum TaxID=2604345 RepID=A0A428U492_9HYPO|nr:hypothetical protein CEP52_004232 [Fusarium oligoseptatum]